MQSLAEMPMNARQKTMVRDSFDQIRDMAGPLATLFYGRLFSMDPSTRPLFKGDIKLQGTKLMGMLDSVVGSLDEFGKLTPVLRELGHRHAVYGVEEGHYQTVSTSLQWALAQALEARFDDETRAAWTALLDHVSTEMLAGAREGPTAAVTSKEN
ncbi:MAG: globin domain-containing protein [Bryobacteraceae bacterium]